MLALQAGMAQRPGEPFDDVDDEAWRGLIRLMRPVAEARDLRVGEEGWSAEGWQVLLWVRGQRFRPTWPELEAKLRSTFGLPRTGMTGGEAAAARQVQAPPEYTERARRIAPPEQPAQPELPGWLDEFRAVSKDQGGPFDQLLLRPLLKLPDLQARAAIAVIRRENEKHRADARFDAAERQAARPARDTDTDLRNRIARALRTDTATEEAPE